jgi:hypothetical protein
MGGTSEHEIITHIHTEASAGEASALDRLVTEAIRSVLGPDYESRWKECFNTPADVCRSLRPAGTVSMVFLTDHVNEKYHRHNGEAVSLAAADPRVAVGAEVQTVWRGGHDEVFGAPEVLVYGRSEPSESAGRRFFGISQEDLDILFRECSVDETGRADILQVRDYCLLNGYAHALAHPFDGSRLPLPALLDVISSFRFVETVNGGFPADSSRRLSMFVSWFNKAAEGLIEESSLSSDLLRALARKARERGPIHPWGGSDAHAENHDRVVVVYRTEMEHPTAGDLFADMVGRGVSDLMAARIFTISGRPASPMRLLDDVARIAYQNVLNHMDLIRGAPRLLEVVSRLQAVTSGEIGQRRARKKALVRSFDETVGGEIRLGLRQARMQIWRRDRPPLGQTSLPDRRP